jgi:DNA polymerase-3 subunit alpha
MAVPLHNHSHKSALDGLATEEEIGQRCQEVDHWAVAVTDHDVCAGHVDFYNTIKKAGLKPLLGVETYQTIGPRQSDFGERSHRLPDGTKEKVDNFHLILLAMNNEGLKNLWAMNSDAHTQGFYYSGRVDWELLAKYNEGIIATSACGLGMLSQAINSNSTLPSAEVILDKYLNIFGDRFYIELSTYSEPWQRSLNYSLSMMAKERGVPMVYANDAHYAFPGQYELHETVICMSQQEKLAELTEPHHTPDLYIMSEEEVSEAFFYLPQSIVDEVLANSDAIGDRCEITLPEFKQHVPVFIPDKGYKNSKEMLFGLAVKGYEEKIVGRGLDDAVYMPRFKYELEVIFDANLYDYLLFVRDVIMSEKEQGVLVGPGRGSVGGSLIAYLVGIHEVDPIRYGLIFERFYNPGRKGSMPDIDVDFPTYRREPIKQRLIQKYGEDYCSDIGTVSTFQGRAAIQKIGITLGVPYNDTTAISKIIEKAIESGQQPKWHGKKGIYEKVGEQLLPYKRKHPRLFDYAEIMYGRTFTYGVHPSGFVVSDVPLKESFPLRWNAKEKKPVTQWDMRIAEKMGFMKMDILGLRNLDTLMMYNEVLKQQGKPTVDFYQVKYMDEDGQLPDEMWEQIDDGNTVGIFQIEDGADAKKLGKNIKPRNLEELALLTALNRPGPLKSGAARRYMRARKTGEWEAMHPVVGKVAAESYGEIIYQEQLINFFVELGYTPAEADGVRKITGKKLREEMEALKEDYEKRFRALGATDEAVEQVWGVVEGFADYAFNKAHSVEYGLISLWTAYAKWLNRTEFYLASIKTLVSEGKKAEVPRYIREARKLGHSILPVDMNESSATTTIQGNAIRYGFNDVKGIGKSAAEWLVNNRPFTDFDDIVAKAEDPTRKVMLKNGTMRMAVDRRHVNLLKQLTTLKDEQLWEVEEALLGYSLSDTSADILDEYADEIEAECTPLNEIDKSGVYNIAGIITNIKETTTKAGAKMAWVTVENGGETIDLAVWNTELERLSYVWRRRQAVVAKVKVTDRGKNILSAKVLYSKKKNYESV